MKKLVNFYVDDSGTRQLDYVPKEPGQQDWYALGGVIVCEEDEEGARKLHKSFCEKWKIDYPLHSVRIRGRTKRFAWLERLQHKERESFFEDLSRMLADAPIVGLACVVDRPGYDQRYRVKYGKRRWALCKTAFTIACERAAKFARFRDRKLRIFVEETDRQSDQKIREHYAGLRAEGMPFANETSSKYGPLSQAELSETLHELRFKRKSSAMIQLADLYLYPLARAGYDEAYRPFSILRENGKLIDCVLEADALPSEGIKYSCFDWKNRKGEDLSSPSPAS